MADKSTIAAIATGTGGGVGMIRLSGPKAFLVADRVFHARNPQKSPLTMPGYTAALGRVTDEGGTLDEAVCTVYRAPHSYTGEDVVELTCHGGAYVLKKVLASTLEAGASLAEPGEYTRRALLNGKMTLTEAEGVVDIIAAENDQSLRAAQGALEGALSRAVTAAADALTDICAHIAAWIDYPEEDVEEVAGAALRERLSSVQERLSTLKKSYDRGRLIREGVSTAIIGSANVGKSTLMNLLSGEERSIVTSIPGTTRDVIEDSVRVGELTLNLKDTAGLRDSDDPIEQIGVEKSRAALKNCDLVLAVFDRSLPLTAAEREWLPLLKGRAAIALFNKSDLGCGLPAEDREEIERNVRCTVTLSAKEREGLGELERAVTEVVGLEGFDPHAAIIANLRQLGCITAALSSLEEGLSALGAGETLDAVSVCLEESADALLKLSGRRASAEMVDKVFEQFCVGK